jgi:hypothetical protein
MAEGWRRREGRDESAVKRKSTLAQSTNTSMSLLSLRLCRRLLRLDGA